MIFYVTGGSRGIGEAIVLDAAAAGHDVAFTYVTRPDLAEAVVTKAKEKAPGAKVRAYELDVRDSNAVEEVTDQVAEEFDNIDVLVNNAGINRPGLAMSMSDEDWKDVLDTNLTGPFYLCRAVLPHFLANRRGRFIHVSSIATYGISGQIGSGREQVLGAVFGARPCHSATVRVDGAEPVHTTPRSAMRAGLAYVQADRRGLASVPQLTARENLTLARLPATTLRRPVLRRGAERQIARDAMADVDVRPLDPERSFALFSGGNQQKIVIGKWLSMHPNVLIVDEPTRGIDVGSKSEIHNLIRGLAEQGYAVIVISSEMPEVLHVSDRIVAMYHGRIMREFTSDEVTEDALVQAISGITGDKVA